MKIHGSANIEYFGADHTVAVTFDFEQNHIETWIPNKHGATPLEQFMSLNDSAAPTLRNIRLTTPLGELHRPAYSDYLVVSSMSDCSKSTDSKAKSRWPLYSENAITHLVFRPRNSLITFDLVDPTSSNRPYEAVFQCQPFRIDQKLECEIAGVNTELSTRNGLFAYSSDHILDPAFTHVIRAALGIATGGPATVRQVRRPESIALNMAPHETGYTHTLWNDERDALQILRSLIVLIAMDPSRDRLARAAEFHALGLVNEGLLETRILSLYTELELIDGAKTLDKKTTAEVLAIDLNEAHLINEVRNALLHNGTSLNVGILDKLASIKKHHSGFTVPFYVDEPSAKNGSQFFFRLAGLLNRYWARRIDLAVKFEDYSWYTNRPSSRTT